MKTSLLVFALAAFLAAAISASAGEKPKDTKEPKAPATGQGEKVQAKSSDQKAVPATGSHIKRYIRRSGHITDGPDRLYVIDAGHIRNSGATDIKQLLVRRGFNR